MEFNLYLTISGPYGTVEAPNNTNPIEADDLADVLKQLSENLPSPMGTQIVGVRIEPVGIPFDRYRE